MFFTSEEIEESDRQQERMTFFYGSVLGYVSLLAIIATPIWLLLR